MKKTKILQSLQGILIIEKLLSTDQTLTQEHLISMKFNIANRGIVEFIEVLKLDVAFLYDLLGASQEQSIKPKFAQTDIDEVIWGLLMSTKKLQNNEFMEALRDRTVKIDVPYVKGLIKK